MALTKTTMTVTITEKGDDWPDEYLLPLLRVRPGVVDVTADIKTREEVPGPNRAKLIELLTWLAGEHAKYELGLPSEWNQGSWLVRRRDLPCGTAACAAGHVFLSDGGRPGLLGDEEWGDVRDGYDWGRGVMPDGREVYVREYATEALGLTPNQAQDLFAANNDYATMRDMIRDLLALTDEPEPVGVPF